MWIFFSARDENNCEMKNSWKLGGKSPCMKTMQVQAKRGFRNISACIATFPEYLHWVSARPFRQKFDQVTVWRLAAPQSRPNVRTWNHSACFSCRAVKKADLPLSRLHDTRIMSRSLKCNWVICILWPSRPLHQGSSKCHHGYSWKNTNTHNAGTQVRQRCKQKKLP